MIAFSTVLYRVQDINIKESIIFYSLVNDNKHTLKRKENLKRLYECRSPIQNASFDTFEGNFAENVIQDTMS